MFTPPAIPHRIVGHEFEDQERFVATMLDALADARAPLPLLQFTAAKLWELRDLETRRISRASYEQLGGVAGALAAHADMVLAASSAREQALIRGVFLSLVTDERTRAIVSLEELRELGRDGSHDEPVLVLRGHEGPLRSARFSRDGKEIVTASADGSARIWDGDTGASVAVLRGHADAVNDAAFSPDGARVVTASRDGTARVWPRAGGDAEVILRGHDSIVYTAAFSPDGARVVTASRDHTARIWTLVEADPAIVLRGHEDTVNSAAFSPDGARVVTTSYDLSARIWSSDGVGAPIVLRGHDDSVMAASFSPDGARVVTASWGASMAPSHPWCSTRPTSIPSASRLGPKGSASSRPRTWSVSRRRGRSGT